MASFRPFWRVRSRIDRLLVAGDISGFEWRCAGELRNLYEKALSSQIRAASLDGTGHGSGHRPNLLPSEQQFAALRRLHQFHDRLDRDTIRLLEAVVVDELCWRELGKRLRVHACTAKRNAIAAIKTLGTAS